MQVSGQRPGEVISVDRVISLPPPLFTLCRIICVSECEICALYSALQNSHIGVEEVVDPGIYTTFTDVKITAMQLLTCQ